MKITLIPLVLAMSFAASSLRSQTVPVTINYQGRLTDNTPSQMPINATIQMQFAIYDAPAGGTRLWQEPALDNTGTAITVTSGIFNYVLGNAVAIPATLFTGATSVRYLQITLNPAGGAEILAPRQLITATGYTNLAQSANDAAALGGSPAVNWQVRLSSNCGGGQALTGFTQSGTPACAAVGAGTVTNVTASAPLSIANGTTTPAISITSPLPVANGGTGSASQNFVDLSTAQTIAGAKTFANNMLLLRNSAGTNSTTLSAPGATVARAITLPDVAGTVITSGNLSGITATGTVASGTWNGTVIGSAYGGTGINTSAAATGSVLATSATGTWSTVTPGGNGLLLKSAAALPIWQALLATDVPNLDASKITSGNLAAARMPAGGAWPLTSTLNVDSNLLVLDRSTFRVGIGTVPATDRLEVAGNIGVTGASGYRQSGAGGEVLRIIRGTVGLNGSIIMGTGYTVSKTGTGVYVINFTTPFGNQPTLTATLYGGYGVPLVSTPGTGSVTLNILAMTGATPVDNAFMFIAIGPP